MRTLKALSLILVLALVLSVGAFAAAEPPAETPSGPSGASGDPVAYVDYIRAWLQNELLQNDQVTQEQLDRLIGILGMLLGGSAEGEDEDYSMEVPPRVAALSEEEDILLNGTLKDGVYINEYFGIKLSIPEGGTLVRDNDNATESTEIIPLSKTYEEGWGQLHFTATIDGIDGFIDVCVQALADDELGLSEEELVRKHIDTMWEINALFGDDEGPDFGTALLAGEEHPMSIETAEYEDGERLYVSFYIPKGDFEYYIYLFANNAKLEDLTSCFEKL